MVSQSVSLGVMPRFGDYAQKFVMFDSYSFVSVGKLL
jgi:hypothetical protein